MSRHSIFFQITVIFCIALLSLGFVFYLFLDNQKRQHMEKLHRRTLDTFQTVLIMQRSLPKPPELSGVIEEFGFRPLPRGETQQVALVSEIVFAQRTRGGELHIRISGSKAYLEFHSPIEHLIAEDTSYAPLNVKPYWLGFGALLLLVVATYATLIRSLLPLRALREQIERFSHGELEINCKSDKHNEIAEVANAFDHAARKIKELVDSRRMFLRMIMHELRTPLAKGRIAAEMLEEGKQKGRIIHTYERLDLLIREFAHIEQLTSKNYALLRKRYPFGAILEQAIDKLMPESKESIMLLSGGEVGIEVDFDLFSTALKNLLDNALRHNSGTSVTLRCDTQGRITLSHTGKPLERPLEHYFQPFHESSDPKRGMGLGLYIVKSILDAHGMTLSYRHEEGINTFAIA